MENVVRIFQQTILFFFCMKQEYLKENNKEKREREKEKEHKNREKVYA